MSSRLHHSIAPVRALYELNWKVARDICYVQLTFEDFDHAIPTSHLQIPQNLPKLYKQADLLPNQICTKSPVVKSWYDTETSQAVTTIPYTSTSYLTTYTVKTVPTVIVTYVPTTTTKTITTGSPCTTTSYKTESSCKTATSCSSW